MSPNPTKKSSATVASGHPQELEYQIRQRAHELYEARGREDGHDLDDWLRAFALDRSDVSFAARVMMHWRDLEHREPSLKIVCRNYSERPQPGLHQWDCPNLLWEMQARTDILRHLRRFVAFRGKESAKSSSGLFQQAGYPDQNHRANKCDNDGADHAAGGPDSQHPEDPAAQDAAEDAENDVYDYAVATTLHNLASKPSGDQSNHNPCEESHVDPP